MKLLAVSIAEGREELILRLRGELIGTGQGASALAGQLDQSATTVVGICPPRDEAEILEAVGQGDDKLRGQSHELAELVLRARLIGGEYGERDVLAVVQLELAESLGRSPEQLERELVDEQAEPVGVAGGNPAVDEAWRGVGHSVERNRA